MTNKHFPELNYLLQLVQKTYGGRLVVPKDFELLAEAIQSSVRQPISNSTIKRLWGYDPYKSIPSPATLDTLARYAGFDGFRAYCASLKDDPTFVSGFLSATCVEAKTLKKGTHVNLGWNPDRLVEVEYLGEHRFSVVKSLNASLQKDDAFEAVAFIKGYPLYLPHFDREGQSTPLYIAGTRDGLTLVEVLPESPRQG